MMEPLVSEDTIREQEEHAENLLQMEITKRASSVIAPTVDEEVKQLLRSLGHPICLFGESKNDRRHRLRRLLAERELLGESDAKVKQELSKLKEVAAKRDSAVGLKGEEVFYTAAMKELVQARKSIAAFSWRQTSKRMRASGVLVEVLMKGEETIGQLYGNCRQMMLQSSQFSDTRRPMTSCKISTCGRFVVTSSSAEVVSVWRRDDCSQLVECIGHTGRVFDVSIHPSTSSFQSVPHSTEAKSSGSQLLLASASFDQTCLLWPLTTDLWDSAGEPGKIQPARRLSGHKNRLSKVCWHPKGDHVLTSSYDYTWRLWDATTGQQLLLQDGHDSGVYGLAVHPEGSLVASGDLDGLTLLWDIRSGKLVDSIVGHARKVLSAAFSPTCVELATSSDDHTVQIYDLRKQQISGSLLFTSAYDGLIKAWSSRDYSLLTTLRGHQGKVTEMDVYENGSSLTVVSSGYDDKTWKIWS